jgi:8-oxo-dGTP pyrophosphatase MutT (NUDIX family)
MDGLYLFGATATAVVCIVVAMVLKSKLKRMQTIVSYYRSAKEAESAFAASEGKKQKTFAYGTVVYLPPKSKVTVDFGSAKVWPPVYKKKDSSPRVLLVSTWTTGKLALPGGGAKKNESVLETVNREFLEETGCKSLTFEESDYIASKIETKISSNGLRDLKLIHFYLKTVDDEVEFNKILTDFHTDPKRKGFVDEIFAPVAVPIWIEGPENPNDICWNNNCWGLPRLLTSGTFREREDLVVLLQCSGVVSLSVMERVFKLANVIEIQYRNLTLATQLCSVVNWALGETDTSLPTFAAWVQTPGLEAVLTAAAAAKNE